MPQPENPVAHQPVTQAMRDRSRWHRRTGRGTLRLFRPLFAPLLTRLQSRFQTAIEDSTVPSRLRRIEAMLDDVLNSRAHVERYPELGGTVVATLAAMRSGIERMQVDIDRLAVRIDLLQIAADGSTLDRNEFRAEMIEATTWHRETLKASHALQVDLPRLLNQLAATQLDASRHAMSELIERASAVQAEKLDRHGALLDASQAVQAGIPKLLAQVAALCLQVDRQHTLLDGSRTGLAELIEQFPPQVLERLSALGLSSQLDVANAAQAEILRMTSLLMSRSDRLLQRIPLPLAQDTLVYTPDGYMLLPVEDAVLVSAVWESGGRLEPGTTSIIAALLREGDTAIDVGANVGLTVLPAARRIGPSGRVIAIEPGSRVAGLLRKTLELNFLADRVSLHHCAAGEAEGSASLNIGTILGHSSLLDLPRSTRQETVEVRTVDSLVPHGTSVRVAKLDVEGFEPQVWRGMRRVIAENPELTVLVEFGPEHLRRAGLSVEDWFAEMLAPDFVAYEVAEMTGHLRPLRAATDLAEVSSLNLLLLRQSPAAFPELRFEQA